MVHQATTIPSVRIEFRAWPLDESIRHLVLLDVGMVPTPDQVDEWVATTFDAPSGPSAPRALRTGALYAQAAEPFLARGFAVVDRLALLACELDHVPARRRSGGADDADRTAEIRLRRLSPHHLDEAASIDQMCFAPGWQNDARSLADIASATPRSRLRRAVAAPSDLRERGRTRNGAVRSDIGFAITGRAGTVGYLQRLAVRPSEQGRGIGGLLVDDALRWLSHRGATRALVNTAIDNHAALRLYGRAGFRRLPDDLVVLELRPPT